VISLSVRIWILLIPFVVRFRIQTVIIRDRPAPMIQYVDIKVERASAAPSTENFSCQLLNISQAILKKMQTIRVHAPE